MESRDVLKVKCSSCKQFIVVKNGMFIKHRTGKGKKKPFCTMGGRRAIRQQ